MPGYVTLPERKSREVLRLKAAAVAIAEALGDYARREGGRFAIFGSAAAGTLRHDSDLDILVDFPPDKAAAAWSFVEDLCSSHAVTGDIHDADGLSDRFRERIASKMIVLE